MSIIKMRNSSSKYGRPILFIIAFIFFVGCFTLYSGYVGGDRNAARDKQNARIATVNGWNITQADFNAQYNQQRTFMAMMGGSTAGIGQDIQIKIQALQQLINGTIMATAAEQKGIEASRRDMKNMREKMIDEKVDFEKIRAGGGKKISDEDFRILLKNDGLTINKLRNEFSQQITDNEVKQRVLIDKLNAQILAKVGRVDDKQVEDSYRMIKVRHIVFSTSNTPDAQAKRKAEEVLKKINAGEDFAKLAQEYSNDEHTKKQGGLMPNEVPASVEKDLQKLKVGQVSGVLKTSYGYRIAKIEDSKFNAEEYKKNKEKKRKEIADGLVGQQMQTIMQDAQKKAKITVHDPELNGYWIMNQPESDPKARSKKMKDAMASFEKASKTGSVSANYMLAVLYNAQFQETKDKIMLQKGIDLLVRILDREQSAEGPELRMMLAQLYISNGQKDKAIPHLQSAGEQSYDMRLHMQLMESYKEAGRADLAAKENQWIMDRQKAMEANMPKETPASKSDKKPVSSPKR